MVVTLSPWPLSTSVVSRAAARDFLRANVSGLDDAGSDDSRVDLLGETSSGIIERFAPDAPSPIKAEATLRVAAYLVAYQPRGVQNIRGGGLNIRFERSRFFAPDPLSNSGALALLAPWRTHRALAIEEPDS